MGEGPGTKSVAGIGVVASVAVGVWRRLTRRPSSKGTKMTWDELAHELDKAGLPRTLAGVAALHKSSEAEALSYLRSVPELAETAEVLADPETMAALAESDREEAAERRGVPWAEVRAELAKRRA